MTHPKRPLRATSATSSASVRNSASANHSGGPFASPSHRSPCSPVMKKAKSQQAPGAACSLDKNGLHQPQHQQAPGDEGGSAPTDEDAMLVEHDDLQAAATDAIPSTALTTGSAANLSRKKAIPPQPAAKKQLVIKLVKGVLIPLHLCCAGSSPFATIISYLSVLLAAHISCSHFYRICSGL